MHNSFQQSFYIPGTWAANHTLVFKTPGDLQLVHVSLCNTSANAGTCKIGHSSDDDAYLTAVNFGVSSTPAEVNAFSAFAGGQFAHIPKGTIVVITLTDHASHMANATVVLTFTEG